MTPQFVYYVIPIAALLSVLVTFGLLSRNSELTVMKACGISLYRASLSVVLLSLVFSADDLRPRAAGPGAGQPQGRGHRREDPRPDAAGVRRAEPAVGDRPRRRDSTTTRTSTPSEGAGRAAHLPAGAPRSGSWRTADVRRPGDVYGGGWIGPAGPDRRLHLARRPRWTDVRRAAAARSSRRTTSRPSSRSPK